MYTFIYTFCGCSANSTVKCSRCFSSVTTGCMHAHCNVKDSMIL